jgi:hypothetical protein
MKILILNDFHHKNKFGLERLLKYMKLEHEFTNDMKKIDQYDVIYSPSTAIDTALYPNKRFIFGPHFSVFPDSKLKSINNILQNAVYIQPSQWCVELWKGLGVTNYLPIKLFPFPVDVDKFAPKLSSTKDKVYVYIKRRKPEELQTIRDLLKVRNIEYHVYDYCARYDENHYLDFLQNAKFGIILDAHESQGFAIQEALSCNVPLLVWNVRFLNQEVGSNYPQLFATSIGYWDERCGEYFYDATELEKTFDTFLSKLDSYKPREYIVDNLSLEPCSKRFKQIFYLGDDIL